jgi:ATP-dependent helicase/nuclease subunit B
MSVLRRRWLTRKGASAAGQLEFDLFKEPSRAKGKVYTIASDAPFLDTLARSLIAGNLPREGGPPPSPGSLADTLIYLPTRAACHAMAGALLRASGGGALLLPRLRPLGSAEEDALLLLTPDDETAAERGLPVAPAIGALERRMVLTKLILVWAWQLRQSRAGALAGLNVAATPAAAGELALELMRLMDEAETEAVDLRQIRALLPDRFAEHEQLSLSFLNIVLNVWPDYLEERKALNPIDRRNRIMALEVERLRKAQPAGPVIVAGSTGSIPATAALMQAVFDLPNGAIVLPGLDLALDDLGWNALALHPEHPQSGFYGLLGGLRASRPDITALRTTDNGAAATRTRFISEALRPASTMGRWPQFVATVDAAKVRESFDGVSLVTASNEEDEAATVALILREAVEIPGRTATLVTPDRMLARRVSAELGRWGLDVPDEVGETLRATSAGAFYDFLAEAAATGSQIAMLDLLKHPLTRLGMPIEQLQAGARVLEIAGLRQPWCGEGLDALSRSLHLAQKAKPRHPSIDLFSEEDWNATAELLRRLKEALWPLTQFARAGQMPFTSLAKAHVEAATLLARDETGEGTALLADTASQAMAELMVTLATDIPGPTVALAEYPALFRTLIKLERIQPVATHPRLRILAPAQARLMPLDLVILGGLNDGTWPEAADTGPWLNRAMRANLGMAPPERRTRFATHDFCQLMGTPEVVLTRAAKVEGTPTVPSRWLTRIETLFQACGLGGVLEARRPWRQWAAARNAVAPRPAVRPTAPCPPLAARPRTLSVSAIETLIANPYAIFARHILGLIPLEPLESEPDGDERGRIIHETLHFFARRFEAVLPPDPAAILTEIFDERAALFSDYARVKAFWRPRLARFARWFAETEAARRQGAQVFSEVRGELGLTLPGGDFTLTARADRIDLHTSGTLAIYDYKSGGMPGEKAVADFKSPQLPLEALIAIEGNFRGIVSRDVTKLAFISARGGEPAGAERILEKSPPSVLAQGAREGLVDLINQFDLAETPYPALRRPAFADVYKFDVYAHLARIGEWGGLSEDDK